MKKTTITKAGNPYRNEEKVTGYIYTDKKRKLFVYKTGNGWSILEPTTGMGIGMHVSPITRSKAIFVATKSIDSSLKRLKITWKQLIKAQPVLNTIK